MKLLLDTNIILRLGHQGSNHHAQTFAAVEALNLSGVTLCIVPQVLYEYWVVATRPIASNGFGMSVSAVDEAVSRLTQLFHLCLDERGIFNYWRKAVLMQNIQGKLAHDARLVAAMYKHEIQNILTYNLSDFSRFYDIRSFTPNDVLEKRIMLK